MTDDQPTRSVGEGEPSLADVSSLKGLTRVLGLEPAQPGHDPLLGCDIGGVTIVKLIAEGGMGRVYEGKQDKPSRTVAVKFMRPGLTSPSLLKRFEYEAEVLGRLQHPGIAHIYSVGVHHLGNATVPYFVMEYIADARTLTKYADDLKLPTRQRLDLFRSVCDAVAHGHQKGVIHRDLKPSNILVDATGQPKVIDFGVARATDSDMALTTMQTDVGQLIGTLQYMSPEQFDADPNDIDIRSDVYALGVILYELLAGKPPYDVKKKAVYEVMRIVKEEDPTPLSSLNRGLRGDVAVIAGKCLEKDRGRRYSSASEVGSDIGRYLTGEPIAASPPGFVDGFARLARKHRAAALAIVVGLAGLAATAVGTTFFALLADQQRQQAVVERDRANVAESQLRNQVYDANIHEIDRLLTDANGLQNFSNPGRTKAHTLARSLAVQTRELFKNPPVPLELSCLLTQFDGEDNALEGHLSPMTCHAFAPECRYLATGHEDGTVRMWPLEGKKRQPMIVDGAYLPIRQVFFSGDGTKVAALAAKYVGGEQFSIHVWDANTHEDIAVFSDKENSTTFRTHGCCALNHSGQQLAVGQSSQVAVWDVGTRSLVKRLRSSKDIAEHYSAYPSFSSDGSRVAATTSGNGTVLLAWDVDTAQELLVKEFSSIGFKPGRFSPDGTKLAAIFHDTVRIIDIESKQEVTAITAGDRNGVSTTFEDAAYGVDGTQVITIGSGYLRAWDAVSGKEVGEVKVEQRSAGKVPMGDVLGFRSESERVMFLSGDAKTLSWETQSGQMRTEVTGLTGCVSSVAFSSDSSRIATGSWDNTVRVWSAVTGQEIASLEGHSDKVNFVAFSADDTRLVSWSDDGSVRLWDAHTGQEAARFTPNGGQVTSIAFSIEGLHLAAGLADGEVRVWQITTGLEVLALDANADAHKGSGWQGKTPVALSRDGRYLAASRGGHTQLWDPVTGVKLLSIKDGKSDLAFSPDGSRLVTLGNGVLRVWELPSGRSLPEPKDMQGSCSAVAFNSDGTLIALASDYRGQGMGALVRLMQADKMESDCGVSYGMPQYRSRGKKGEDVLVDASSHADGVRAVAFSPDGTQLLTGSKDGTARVWGRTSSEIRAARAHVAEIRGRLKPMVDAWFSQGPRAAVVRLRESKAGLTQEEYREAANMVLKQCVADRRASGTP